MGCSNSVPTKEGGAATHQPKTNTNNNTAAAAGNAAQQSKPTSSVASDNIQLQQEPTAGEDNTEVEKKEPEAERSLPPLSAAEIQTKGPEREQPEKANAAEEHDSDNTMDQMKNDHTAQRGIVEPVSSDSHQNDHQEEKETSVPVPAAAAVDKLPTPSEGDERDEATTTATNSEEVINCMSRPLPAAITEERVDGEVKEGAEAIEPTQLSMGGNAADEADAEPSLPPVTVLVTSEKEANAEQPSEPESAVDCRDTLADGGLDGVVVALHCDDDGDDDNWVDLASADVSREASPEATFSHLVSEKREKSAAVGIVSGGGLQHRELSHLCDGNITSSATGQQAGGERLLIRAVRKGQPHVGTNKKSMRIKHQNGHAPERILTSNGSFGSLSSSKRASSPFLSIDDGEGFAHQQQQLKGGGGDKGAPFPLPPNASTSRHSSSYYSALRLGAPLRFRHEGVPRPLTSMGWTCCPTSKSQIYLPTSYARFSGALPAQSFSLASSRPIQYEVKLLRDDGSVGATRLISGSAARLLRGATGCGFAGASVAIHQAEKAVGRYRTSRGPSIQASPEGHADATAADAKARSERTGEAGGSKSSNDSDFFQKDQSPSEISSPSSPTGTVSLGATFSGTNRNPTTAAFVMQRNGFTSGYPFVRRTAKGKSTSSFLR